MSSFIIGLSKKAIKNEDNKFFSSAPKEAREVLIFTIYKVCDMALIDNFLLLKLFVIFPAVSALAAWICILF